MQNEDEILSKVPEVTLGFWVIKILATTLGETGGDAVTMTWLHADAHPHNGGYLIGTGIFLAVFVAAVFAQILTRKFNPWIYWLAIVASRKVSARSQRNSAYAAASTHARVTTLCGLQ